MLYLLILLQFLLIGWERLIDYRSCYMVYVWIPTTGDVLHFCFTCLGLLACKWEAAVKKSWTCGLQAVPEEFTKPTAEVCFKYESVLLKPVNKSGSGIWQTVLSHSFFNFSDECCSCKLVSSRLRYFEVCVENKPILECGARLYTVLWHVWLQSAQLLTYLLIKYLGVLEFEHTSFLREVFLILNGESRVKHLLLSFSHLL